MSTPPLLKVSQDGRLHSDRALASAFMAPRLQGEHRPDGSLKLALWGAGDLGRLSFAGWDGPFTYGPNGVENGRGEGVFVAQDAPVVLLRGARLRRFHPAARSARWDVADPAVRAGPDEAGRFWWAQPWGSTVVESRGRDLLVAAGQDEAEARRGLALSAAEVVAQHRANEAASDVLPEAEPFLRSLVRFGAHAALASIRTDAGGRFAGLAAGPAYSTPARTYYRDGYWTLPMLLRLRPAAARDWIEAIAAGIQPDGEAPSAVLTGGAEQIRRFAARGEAAHARPGEWWSDHFDSPLYFVLAVSAYLEATGDVGPLRRWRPQVRAVFERYRVLAIVGDGFPLKPRHDRDWADNVFRSGAVAYDLGLWIGAADAVARLADDPTLAARAGAAAVEARNGLDRLWRPERGWWADYADPDGFSEDHLALDSLTLLRFDAVGPHRARALLHATASRLERSWGVACVDPRYARRLDLRAKSAFAGRYHNGGDWPWLDGLYAGERLRRGMPGWAHPLTAWWRTCLDRGWTSPVEHHAPAWGRGSLLQAWSSLPAAVVLANRETALAAQAGWKTMATPFMQ